MHGYSPIFRGHASFFFYPSSRRRRRPEGVIVALGFVVAHHPLPPRGAAKSRARDSRARDARRRVGRVEPPGDGAAAPDDAGRGEGEAAGRARTRPRRDGRSSRTSPR